MRDEWAAVMSISAVAIADEFLKKGELIVKTKNKSEKLNQTLATDKEFMKTGKSNRFD